MQNECPRQKRERLETVILSKYACFATTSKGRDKYEPQCSIRTDFQRDRDRIIHCKSFRRLKHKTQVFIAPEGDHYRTRLTHTLEVTQIARTIARALDLNEDLVEAIALGHDLGHTPFGHAGERVLNEITDEGFFHNKQSLRIVEHLERGRGLNLTAEVRDGILNHRTGCNPMTLEGQVVLISDKIAYINHDIDDAIQARLLDETDLPKNSIELFGIGTSNRINSMIHDVINHCMNKNRVEMSLYGKEATKLLRDYLFDNLYMLDRAKEQEKKAEHVLTNLFKYYHQNQNSMPKEYLKIAQTENIQRAVCDYIAGMSDQYAIQMFKEIFVPKSLL